MNTRFVVKDSSYSGKLLLPTLVDFDKKKIIFDINSEKVEIKTTWEMQFGLQIFQGLYGLAKRKFSKLPVIFNSLAEGNGADCDLSAHSISISNKTPFVITPCVTVFNASEEKNKDGHIWYRRTLDEFKQQGLAAYGLDRIEKHMKQNGKLEEIHIITGKTDEHYNELSAFLAKQGYADIESENGRNIFAKNEGIINCDETDNMFEWTKFIAISQSHHNQTVEIAIKI